MSGAGRKSAYRKGVTSRVLYGDPEPKENELIVRVTALRGSNLFEVVDAEGTKAVTMLPTKFRKLIWVKRGDFLIVGEGDGGEATTAKGKKGAVTSIVEHILYKDQIKNLKRKDLWPAAFDDPSASTAWTQVDDPNGDNEEKGEDKDAEEDDATASSSSKGLTMVADRFDQMKVNRNRRKGHFDDEEEEEDSDDERAAADTEAKLSIMQRKRSNVYSAGPSVLHHRHSQPAKNNDPENPDMQLGVFGKYSEKDFFSDLRVEIDRELTAKHAVHPGYLRSKASIMRSSGITRVTTRGKSTTNVPESSALVPSSIRQIQRRCQSASAVRKKLFHAVEQGSTTEYQHPNHKLQAKIDALRNLAAGSLSKTPTKTQNRAPNADTSICHGIVNLSRKNSGVSVPTCKTQNQEGCISGVGIGPSRSASASILMATSTQPYQPQPVLVGGYRSSSVQLEIELVERLNEIGRSNLPEKTLSRTRACRTVLDSIVLQDEHYGRLLSRIRDEFSTYVDMTCRKKFALLKQENTVMKKRVSSMQDEIDNLQAALRQARTGDSSGRSNSSVGWPEDGQTQEDDLNDVQLFPAEGMHEQHFRPLGVPMLSFAALPSYSEEEEDEGGQEEEGYTSETTF
ncbi:hypothetical protein PF008_g678 [Phytophthora fragariae]|uniref:S1-like domain-containing protein n=1 Tax=Phytophthora fragariae TaxID=53985 RepID=A0A6G0SPC0_9STRA|nr:hypothetical protein PF008_g678 [Phytophthora fragariae]